MPPDGTAKSDSAASDARRAAEEKRHDQREELLEDRLVCLTAILAAIEIGTLFIFYFTMKANEVAAKAAKESADSYSKQLALQARPLLRVRQARVETERPYIKVNYVLVNVGGSIAHIISLTHSLSVGTAPPQIFGEEPFDLAPGQKFVAMLQTGSSHSRDQPLPPLRLSGRVIYQDDAGIVRETSFDRPYYLAGRSFERAPNWDSEYED
jgi:hypothetical protein